MLSLPVFYKKVIVIASFGLFLSYHYKQALRWSGQGGGDSQGSSWARNGIVIERDGTRWGVRLLGKSYCETESLFSGD